MKNIYKLVLVSLILILGISAKATITQLGSITDDGKGGVASKIAVPEKVFIDGNRAYVTSSVENALSIFDITNPNNIIELGTISDDSVGGKATRLNQATGIFVVNSKAYVTSGEDSLSIFDVSNPANIVELGVIEDTFRDGPDIAMRLPFGVFVRSNLAYVVSSYSNTMTVLDVSNPSNIIPIGTPKLFIGYSTSLCEGADFRNTQDFKIVGNIFYALCDSGISAYDISNPTNITLLGQAVNSQFIGTHFSIDNNRAAVISRSNNDGRMFIYDVANPANMSLLGTIRSTSEGGTIKNLSLPTSVVVKGNNVYVTSDDIPPMGVTSSLMRFDISNPSNITLLETITDDFDGGKATRLKDPSDMVIVGDKAYVITGFNLKASDDSLAIFKLEDGITAPLIPDAATSLKINNNQANGFILDASISPKFSWNAATGATGYDLLVKNSAGAIFINQEINDGITSFVSLNTLAIGNYSFSVRSFSKVQGVKTSGDIRSANFSVLSLPGAFTINTPVGLNTSNPGFSWTASAYASAYRVMIKNKITGAVIYPVTTLTTTNLNLNSALADGTYTISIVASNSLGSIAAVNKDFTVSVNTADPVTGIKINNNIANDYILDATLVPTFSWNAAAKATGYDLVVRTAKGVALITKEVNSGTSFIAPDTLGVGNYSVSVTSFTKSGTTKISGPTSSANFAVVSIPAPVTAIKINNNIANGYILDAAIVPTFSWNAAARATGYDLLVKNASGLVVINKEVNNGTSFVSPTVLAAGNYTLAVSSFSKAGTVKTLGGANVVNFSVMAKPGSFAINTPSGLNTPKPSFSWTMSSSATSYKVVIKNKTTGAVVYPETSMIATSLNLNSNLLDGTYTITVSAINAVGNVSVTKDFTILTAPAAVTNLSASLSSDRKFVVSWTGVYNATVYDVTVINVVTNATVFKSTLTVNAPKTTVTTDAIAKTDGGAYNVVVAARNTAGSSHGAASNLVIYNSDIGAFPNSSITSPANGNPTLISGSDFTFKWDHVQGAISYRIRIETRVGNKLITNFNNVAVTALSYTATLPTMASGNYQVTIVPIDGSGKDVEAKRAVQFFKI